MKAPITSRQCLVFSVATLLGACGPIYDTRHVLTPPKSESGRFCVYQCETSKQQCEQSEDLRQQNCELRSEIDVANCEAEIRISKGREPKWYECGGSACSADYERCESRYRSCYQACGGKVDTITECVSNCDQIPPDKR